MKIRPIIPLLGLAIGFLVAKNAGKGTYAALLYALVGALVLSLLALAAVAALLSAAQNGGTSAPKPGDDGFIGPVMPEEFIGK